MANYGSRLALTIEEYAEKYLPKVTQEQLNWAEDALAEGVKDDLGKIRYDLIPPDALEELARVYTFGAGKYADRNWEKGLLFSRVFGAMMRHAWLWFRGQDIDDGPGGSGLNHLSSVAWCAFSLMAYQKRNMKDFDDRVTC